MYFHICSYCTSNSGPSLSSSQIRFKQTVGSWRGMKNMYIALYTLYLSQSIPFLLISLLQKTKRRRVEGKEPLLVQYTMYNVRITTSRSSISSTSHSSTSHKSTSVQANSVQLERGGGSRKAVVEVGQILRESHRTLRVFVLILIK